MTTVHLSFVGHHAMQLTDAGHRRDIEVEMPRVPCEGETIDLAETVTDGEDGVIIVSAYVRRVVWMVPLNGPVSAYVVVGPERLDGV